MASTLSSTGLIYIIGKLLTLVHGLISTAKKRKEQKRVQEIRDDAVTTFLDTFNPSSKSKDS